MHRVSGHDARRMSANDDNADEAQPGVIVRALQRVVAIEPRELRICRQPRIEHYYKWRGFSPWCFFLNATTRKTSSAFSPLRTVPPSCLA